MSTRKKTVATSNASYRERRVLLAGDAAHVHGTDEGLRDALTTWFGPPNHG